MRAINTGNTYRIYDNSMQIYNELPAQSYQVCFNPNSGFFLEKYSDIEIKEKVYGVHAEKVKKVMDSFHSFNRNLGIILSGDKGIGKSLFSKVLAKTAIEEGFPLIIVNTYIPGIADYINSIEQEVVVLFDEFDKTFSTGRNSDGLSPQTEMLTLFDGISMGKKLFIVTCNELHNLNDYLINRPGRFHYHFRFEYPKADEIREYLMDKLSEEYYGEIDKVINFSHKVSLNYDCLRAIAFELSRGDSFEIAIKDLNILHLCEDRYDLILYFKDGTNLRIKGNFLDMFDDNEVTREFEDPDTRYDVLYATFTPSDNRYDYDRGGCIIDGKNLKIEIHKYLNDESNKGFKVLYDKYINLEPDFLLIKRRIDKNLHYTL